MTDNTFVYIGTSVQKEQAKIRFANDLDRVKILVKNGHTEIELIELPEPMTKPKAVAFLMKQEDFKGDREAIENANDKYNTVKVKKAKVTAKKEDVPATDAKEVGADEEADPEMVIDVVLDAPAEAEVEAETAE